MTTSNKCKNLTFNHGSAGPNICWSHKGARRRFDSAAEKRKTSSWSVLMGLDSNYIIPFISTCKGASRKSRRPKLPLRVRLCCRVAIIPMANYSYYLYKYMHSKFNLLYYKHKWWLIQNSSLFYQHFPNFITPSLVIYLSDLKYLYYNRKDIMFYLIS